MRIGIVGLGGISRGHITGWKQLRAEGPIELHGYDVAVGPGVDPEVTLHDSIFDLVEAVDVVDVCTPTSFHAEMVGIAADANKPVLCEKPLALTWDDALTVARYCYDEQVYLQPGHIVRYYPAYAAAKDSFASGKYGQPAVLRFRRAGEKPGPAWMADDEQSGGIAQDLMIHDIDQARWYAGDIVAVQANLRDVDPAGGRPHCYAILTHASGAITHLTGSWALHQGFETSFEIAGTEGMLSYDSRAKPALRSDHPSLAQAAANVTDANPFALQQRDFLLAVTTGRRARVSLADGMAALSASIAMRESIRTGQPQVPEPVPEVLIEAAAQGATR